MKAIQTVNPSEMRVAELEEPTVGAGGVLVRIKYVGSCGSDSNTFLGRNPMVKLPAIPGHEVGVVIEEIGPDVPAGPEKGMNVILNPYTNCGKCASCRNGHVNICEHNEILGVQRSGVMYEYAALPWTKIIPVGNISPRDCALIEPMSVGFHAASCAQVIDNEYAMVIGCGTIGIGTIVHATRRGVTAIAVDLDDEKLILARKVGVPYAVNSKTENVYKRIQEITVGFGADIVIEVVSSPVTYAMVVDEVDFTDRMACIGYVKKEVASQTKYFVQKELDIRGSRDTLPADFRVVISHMKEGKCSVEELISKIAKPEDALEAMKEWAADPRKVFRILAEM